MNVLVLCTQPLNAGDELLVDNLHGALLARFPTASIRETTLRTWPAGGRPALQQPLLGLMRVSERLGPRLGAHLARALVPVAMTLLRGLARLPEQWRPRLLPASWARVLRAAQEADLLVMTPGGFLIAEQDYQWYWLSHLLTLQLVALSGRRAVAAPCSLGPFHASWLPRARQLSPLIEHLCVRDDVSVRWAAALGFPPADVTRTVDFGFALPPSRVPALPVPGRPPVLGIAARHYSFPGAPDPAAAREAFEAALISAVRQLVDAGGYRVVFSCHDLSGTDNDVAYAQHLAARLDRGATVMDRRLGVTELLDLYNGMDALVGVRLHACVMALLTGTPVVPIAYEPKTSGVLVDFGATQAPLQIGSLSAPELVDRVHQALKASDRPGLRQQARDAGRRAESFLDRLDLAASPPPLP